MFKHICQLPGLDWASESVPEAGVDPRSPEPQLYTLSLSLACPSNGIGDFQQVSKPLGASPSLLEEVSACWEAPQEMDASTVVCPRRCVQGKVLCYLGRGICHITTPLTHHGPVARIESTRSCCVCVKYRAAQRVLLRLPGYFLWLLLPSALPAGLIGLGALQLGARETTGWYKGAVTRHNRIKWRNTDSSRQIFLLGGG